MSKTKRSGVPATQFVKHLIIGAVDDEVLPYPNPKALKTLKENPTEQDINDFLDSI